MAVQDSSSKRRSLANQKRPRSSTSISNSVPSILACDVKLSQVSSRDPDDIVGKRVLCIPQNFEIASPSPVQLSSSLWLPSTLAAIKESSPPSADDYSSASDTQVPYWCPIHHHHQDSQKDFVRLATENRLPNWQVGFHTDLLDSNSKRMRVSRQPSSHKKTTSPSRQSYSVMKSLQQSSKLSNSPLASTETQSNDLKFSKNETKADCEWCVNIADETLSPDSAELHKRHLNSLPWRLGTIRAVSHRDLDDDSLGLMIEFDLLEWQERDWYQVRDRIEEDNKSDDEISTRDDEDEVGEKVGGSSDKKNLRRISKGRNESDTRSKSKQIKLEITESTSYSSLRDMPYSDISKKSENSAGKSRMKDVRDRVDESLETKNNGDNLGDKSVSSRPSTTKDENAGDTYSSGAFSALLVESSICCLSRKHSPIGKEKLWPALIFEPLIDELGLFDSCTNLKAIEYFDPSSNYRDNTIKQPICDIKAIMSELKTEFSNLLSELPEGVRKLLETTSSDLKRSIQDNNKQDDCEQQFFQADEGASKKGQPFVDGSNCLCWSPRVEFVHESIVYKFCDPANNNKGALTSFEGTSSLSSNNESSTGRSKDEIGGSSVTTNLGEQTAVARTKVEKAHSNSSNCSSSSGGSHQETSEAQEEAGVGVGGGSLIQAVSGSNLNSFKRFLRFFHQVHLSLILRIRRHLLRQKQASDSNSSNGFNPMADPLQESKCVDIVLSATKAHSGTRSNEDETASTLIATTNDLLEAIVQYPKLYHLLREWHFYQDAQSLLGNRFTASLLVGNRVKIYRSSGTTQWYTGVIIFYDERTNLLTLIDDTVLEEHHEDPTLLEMHLIDDGLVQSIIEGDNATASGSLRRRTQRSAANQRQAAQTAQLAIANSSTASSIAANSTSANSGPAVISKQPNSSGKLGGSALAAHSSLSPSPSAASSSSSSALGSSSQQQKPFEAIAAVVESSGQARATNFSLDYVVAGTACGKHTSSTKQNSNNNDKTINKDATTTSKPRGKRSNSQQAAARYQQASDSDADLDTSEANYWPKLWAGSYRVDDDDDDEQHKCRRLRQFKALEELEEAGEDLSEFKLIHRSCPSTSDEPDSLRPQGTVGVLSSSVKFGHSKGATVGRNFLSHRLRLEALEGSRLPLNGNGKGCDAQHNMSSSSKANEDRLASRTDFFKSQQSTSSPGRDLLAEADVSFRQVHLNKVQSKEKSSPVVRANQRDDYKEKEEEGGGAAQAFSRCQPAAAETDARPSAAEGGASGGAKANANAKGEAGPEAAEATPQERDHGQEEEKCADGLAQAGQRQRPSSRATSPASASAASAFGPLEGSQDQRPPEQAAGARPSEAAPAAGKAARGKQRLKEQQPAAAGRQTEASERKEDGEDAGHRARLSSYGQRHSSGAEQFPRSNCFRSNLASAGSLARNSGERKAEDSPAPCCALAAAPAGQSNGPGDAQEQVGGSGGRRSSLSAGLAGKQRQADAPSQAGCKGNLQPVGGEHSHSWPAEQERRARQAEAGAGAGEPGSGQSDDFHHCRLPANHQVQAQQYAPSLRASSAAAAAAAASASVGAHKAGEREPEKEKEQQAERQQQATLASRVDQIRATLHDSLHTPKSSGGASRSSSSGGASASTPTSSMIFKPANSAAVAAAAAAAAQAAQAQAQQPQAQAAAAATTAAPDFGAPAAQASASAAAQEQAESAARAAAAVAGSQSSSSGGSSSSGSGKLEAGQQASSPVSAEAEAEAAAAVVVVAAARRAAAPIQASGQAANLDSNANLSANLGANCADSNSNLSPNSAAAKASRGSSVVRSREEEKSKNNSRNSNKRDANLSPPLPSQASESVLAAAVALQSLNQSSNRAQVATGRQLASPSSNSNSSPSFNCSASSASSASHRPPGTASVAAPQNGPTWPAEQSQARWQQLHQQLFQASSGAKQVSERITNLNSGATTTALGHFQPAASTSAVSNPGNSNNMIGQDGESSNNATAPQPPAAGAPATATTAAALPTAGAANSLAPLRAGSKQQQQQQAGADLRHLQHLQHLHQQQQHHLQQQHQQQQPPQTHPPNVSHPDHHFAFNSNQQQHQLGLEAAKLRANQQQPNNNTNNNLNYAQWLDELKGANNNLTQNSPSKQLLQLHHEAQKSHLNNQRANDEMEQIKNAERLRSFAFKLASHIQADGSNLPKKIFPIDSLDGLRQSINSGEFYTKYETLAYAILQNTLIVPEFSILDYVRRDKFSLMELEKMDLVHKRCGQPIMSIMQDLAQQRSPYAPNPILSNSNNNNNKNINDIRLSHLDATNNLNHLGSSIYQQQQQIQHPHQAHAHQHESLKALPFLPPLTGLGGTKSDVANLPIGGGPFDRSRQKSQSPSDIVPRSQSNTGLGPRMLNTPHSSASAHQQQPQHHQGFSSNSQASLGNHLPPPLLVSPHQRPPMLGQQHYPLHAARSSPFQASNVQVVNSGQQNPYLPPGPRPILPPPPSQAPKTNPASLGLAHESPLSLSYSSSSSSSLAAVAAAASSSSFPSPNYPRQPPAAHQSSSARSSVLGSSLSVAHARSGSISSNGPPVSAHMSSKTPQTPRLQAQDPLVASQARLNSSEQQQHHQSSSLGRPPDDRLVVKAYGGPSPGHPSAINSYSSPKCNDIEPITGLPVQTILTMKQQDLMARELTTLKRSGTPHFLNNHTGTQNFAGTGPHHQHSLDISRSPSGCMDSHVNSRSPMNSQSIYAGPHTGASINNGSMFKSPSGQSITTMLANQSSMPPPSLDYHKNMNQANDLNRLNEPRSSMLSPNLNPNFVPTNEIQLKQYTALLNSYQQHLMMANKGPNNNSVGPGQSPSSQLSLGLNQIQQGINLQPPMRSPQQTTSDAMLLDLQNIQNSSHLDGRPGSQQASPKQTNNQRSIITGSASSGGQKRNKKIKHSPSSSFQSNSPANDTSKCSTPSSIAHQQDTNPNATHSSNNNTTPPTGSIESTNNSVNQAMEMEMNQPQLDGGSQNLLTDAMKLLQETATQKLQPEYGQPGGDQIMQLESGTKPSDLNNTQASPAGKQVNNSSNVGSKKFDPSSVAKTSSAIGPALVAAHSTIPTLGTGSDEDVANTCLPLGQSDNISSFIVSSSISEPKNEQAHLVSIITSNETISDQKLSERSVGNKEIDNTSKGRISTETIATSNELPKQALTLDPILPNNSTNVTSQSNAPTTEQSKYQKLYTKKAWLKNYDQEDQARSKTGPEETMAAKGLSKQIVSDSNASNKEASKGGTNVSANMNTSTATVPNESKTAKKNEIKKKNNKDSTSRKTPSQQQSTLTASRAARAGNKSLDNDSELSNASTSELDSDATASSIKSSNDTKQIRRMPRRKVKPSSDKDEQRSPPSTKFNSSKDSARKSASGGGGKKEKSIPEESSIKRKHSIDTEAPSKKSKKAKLSSKLAASKSVESQKGLRRGGQQGGAGTRVLSSTELHRRHKRTGEKFLQKDPCYDIVPKGIRCMECRRVRQSSVKNDKVPSSKQSTKTNWDDFCRFYEFRKLRYNKASQIVVAGFSDLDDAKESDKTLWLPHTSDIPTNLSYNVAKFILANVGNEFCNLVMQERAAKELYETRNGSDRKITWKRAVNGLRELCDVCATTLFNCHYVCEGCGFVVCIDCYQSRTKSITIDRTNGPAGPVIKKEDEGIRDKSSGVLIKGANDSSENFQPDTEQLSTGGTKKNKRDSCGWIYCSKNEEHTHEKLILTQIIAGGCLEEVSKLMHEVRQKLDLGTCTCESKSSKDESQGLDIFIKVEKCDNSNVHQDSKVTALTGKDSFKYDAEHDTGSEGSHSTLKGLLLASNSSNNGVSSSDDKTAVVANFDETSQHKLCFKKEVNEDHTVNPQFSSTCSSSQLSEVKMFNDSSNDDDSQEDTKLSQQVTAAIEGCISSLPNGGVDSPVVPSSPKQNDVHAENEKLSEDPSMESIKNKDCTEMDTHTWLCESDLLVLSKANHKRNIALFRSQWRLGKPVLVRGVDKLMKIDMWLPQFFGKEFGDYRSDLVDCRNGDIHRHSMKKYWEGFEPNSNGASAKKKIKDDNNLPVQIPLASNEECSIGPSYYSGSALWRLKDWPPGQDFYEILPSHYEDFMNNLPLSPYTTRSGKLNLACRLPKEMLKPDLGPKMYSAYGTSKFPERGTTNLHLDISDAINVMVYVSGATSFNSGSEEQRDVFDKTIDECVVDQEMKNQIRSRKFVPGALWHIFKAEDAQKIRDFLNKVSDERKVSPEKRTDPIHDQTWYLDQPLLDRLKQEYGVKSYAILQCMGDAILIPAGAPHQVKNLQNCIKVANDFVSPENVRYCLQLTNEFRSLPETHINQEDKLQIKNILYHSVKESLQFIMLYESGQADIAMKSDSSKEDEETDCSSSCS